MFTGESIAEFLTVAGTPCEFVKVETSAQLYNYYFKYTNIIDSLSIKKSLKLLQTEARQLITYKEFENGVEDEAHFVLQFARIEKPLLRTATAHNYLKQAKPLSILLGKDTNNNWQSSTPKEFTHLLIAGTTGSGKSVALNSLLASLICYNKPEEIGLVIIDLKKIEYLPFEGIPHLEIPVVTEYEEALNTLYKLVEVMEQRYKLQAETGQDNFKTLLVIIDELSDLVLNNKQCKQLLTRLLQKSRGAKIHFIVATQSPRASVLDGATLANLPSRLALTCSNTRESVLILGHKGAERLTGKGDAILKLNGSLEEIRLQIPYISKQELHKIIK